MRETKILIRLNKDEKKILATAATNQGIPISSWARLELLRNARFNSMAVKEVSPVPTSPSLALLSLFCGPGGLDEGFKQAGFQTTLAFDIDKECVNTFKLNHPQAKAYAEDINNLTVQKLDSLNGGTFKPIGVIGGPPCQSFSVSNTHQSDDDPRHKLAETYAKLLSQLNKRNPISFFVFENVPGLLGKKHIDRYKKFKKLFEAAGFNIFEKLLDAKNYEVPQERPRIIIVGINSRLYRNTTWTPPTPKNRLVTVRDVIENLVEPIYNQAGLDPQTFAEHPNHWCLVPRSDKFKNKKQPPVVGRCFRRLSWDSPSWTVAYGHREVHLHPKGHRRLSIYEAMLLQSFPKHYRLTGNMSNQVRLVSEAVPPKLGYEIAKSVRESLGI